MSDFEKCVNFKKRSDGGFIFECKFGFWGVQAFNFETAKSQAVRYFELYKSDGEYSSLIGGKSVVDNLVGAYENRS